MTDSTVPVAQHSDDIQNKTLKQKKSKLKGNNAIQSGIQIAVRIRPFNDK